MSFINIFSMNKVILRIVITLFVSILLNFDVNMEANAKTIGNNSEMVGIAPAERENDKYCLLYTSDAADE